MHLDLRKILILSLFISLTSYTQLYSQTEQDKISSLVNQKRDFNKNNKTSTVYKIQLFNGVEKDAYAKKYKFQSTFPEYKVQIIYVAPEWKTQVGDFNTRLEADRALNIIQQKFIGAFVLEDKI
ncbi:MAG: hypothetical protein R3342_07825 [Lutibacter sp.]|uniref:hypothetical protein n=1 Tax=Lutibacter sp. TaxID=1925666 RepID=UPI00299DC0C7|nr:hypothetical protein [Lutibacter sp.]MDX1829439.1 hypothetical protein [Lutibacter sp.]